MPDKINTEHGTIAIVGPFAYPSGGANALRVGGVASALRSAGWKNVFIGSGQRDDLSRRDSSSLVLGDHVVNLSEYPDPKWPLPLRVLRGLTWGGRTCKWINELKPKPSAIIVYGSHFGYLARILKWCRSTRTPLIVDMVEWYQPSHVSGGAFGPVALLFEITTRFIVPKAGNVIAISNYLNDYYAGKGCHTIKVPPILNVRDTAIGDAAESVRPLKIAYVSIKGKKDKDLLNNILEGLLRIETTGERLQLSIAGSTAEQVLRMPAIRSRNLNALPKNIHALGFVPHEQAMKLIRESHFTALLRPPLRYAMAGFPSKVTESLALGTPVICNLSSDLREYLQDGRECILCDDHSATAFEAALGRALILDLSEINAMRAGARVCAETNFDYRAFADRLKEFMKTISS